MSEQAIETGETPPEGAPAEQEPKTFDADYVDKLRKESAKYRTEAKANADAAKRLAEIESASQTEAEKTAARLAAAESEVAEAKAEALRYRMAVEFKLDDKQAALLRHLKDEEALRELAEALAAHGSDAKKHGNHVPREGATSTSRPPADERRAFADFLTGNRGN